MQPVLVAPLPPVKAMTLATAGSALMTLTSRRMALFMAVKEVSWGPARRRERAGVLLGEESLGDDDEEVDVEARW